MESLLVNLFFFARPLLFVDSGLGFAGLNLFEILTIALSVILIAVGIVNSLSDNSPPVSGLEWLLIVFIVWCTFTGLAFPETFDFKKYVKWVLPFITYLVIKRAIRSREQYQRLFLWLIAGFTIPVLWSCALILQGKGLSMEIYWTGLQRYSGVYNGVHMLGHNMGFLLMAMLIYIAVKKSDIGYPNNTVSWLTYVFFTLLAIAALFALYKSHTRTVYVGVLVFLCVYLFFYSKTLLLGFIATGAVAIIVFASMFSTIFFDVVDVFEGKRDIEKAGSGRPHIWSHNLTIYSQLSIERKLAGVGIGNTVIEKNNSVGSEEIHINNVWNSHNDYLEVLMETGAVGLIIMLSIYIAILRTIMAMDGREKYAFLAFFFAVVVMNFLSNSYLSRFGLAQMFFMLLPYVELFGRQRQEEFPAYKGVRYA